MVDSGAGISEGHASTCREEPYLPGKGMPLTGEDSIALLASAHLRSSGGGLFPLVDIPPAPPPRALGCRALGWA